MASGMDFLRDWNWISFMIDFMGVGANALMLVQRRKDRIVASMVVLFFLIIVGGGLYFSLVSSSSERTFGSGT